MYIFKPVCQFSNPFNVLLWHRPKSYMYINGAAKWKHWGHSDLTSGKQKIIFWGLSSLLNGRKERWMLDPKSLDQFCRQTNYQSWTWGPRAITHGISAKFLWEFYVWLYFCSLMGDNRVGGIHNLLLITKTPWASICRPWHFAVKVFLSTINFISYGKP